ncbi:hypothetical protein AMS69_18035 [Haloarcula rubripromontorii]|uniref:Uncharacterized protein n=1 Tax=Haloarcula rubripromontorii TaxID=1705562 RepID=A0A0M9AJ09_9EURY|nr:hypothetical protein [Haloarcula rubripromontorii]KOX91621.1 hypothetical protein AMS69_18035 [Haloarcula rubripromontorii]
MDAFESPLSEFADEIDAELERKEHQFVISPEAEEWDEDHAQDAAAGMNESRWNEDDRFPDVIATPVITGGTGDGEDIKYGVCVMKEERFRKHEAAADKAVENINQKIAESDVIDVSGFTGGE